MSDRDVLRAITSGLDNPDQLVTPSVEEMALEAVRDLWNRYDECLRETP